jgi:prolyl-tRNA synthetase
MPVRWTKSFIPTLKEIPSDAVMPSHILALKAGLIRPLIAGVYTYLPLGWRVFSKIAAIIREEMDRIGGQELLLPTLTPEELWTETGRVKEFGDIMFSLKDRKGRTICLPPTHEEIITDLVRREIRSYRDLPQIWYHIQLKYRDEPRPRSGLMRVRHFWMKDSYSLDVDERELQKSYDLHREAYQRIFDRCGLRYFIVQASSGVMGGSKSEEFMAETEAGEDRVARCDACGYAANLEVAEGSPRSVEFPDIPLEEVHTPGEKRVDEVSNFLGVEPPQLMKSLIFMDGDLPLFVLVRGDHELNEAKLADQLDAHLRPADPEEVEKLTGAEVGYVSPVGIKGVKVVADHALRGQHGLISGANRNDYHVRGINLDRDVEVSEYLDLRSVQEGDCCPRCKKSLRLIPAVELGHTFMLGTRYSAPMGATFLNAAGEQRPVVMGSYGIGLGRLMATVIEQNHDNDGIFWPPSIAPYDLVILPLNMTHAQTAEVAESLYQHLTRKGLAVLFDDRDERAGVKFKDADLIGVPLRITIGERSLAQGKVELKRRSSGEERAVPVDEVGEAVLQWITEYAAPR